MALDDVRLWNRTQTVFLSSGQKCLPDSWTFAAIWGCGDLFWVSPHCSASNVWNVAWMQQPQGTVISLSGWHYFTKEYDGTFLSIDDLWEHRAYGYIGCVCIEYTWRLAYGKAKTGVSRSDFLIESKACWAESDQLNFKPFFVNAVKGSAVFAKSLTNRR